MARIRSARVGDGLGVAHVYVETWRSIYAGAIPDTVLTRMSVPHTAKAWDRDIATSRSGRRVHVAVGGSGAIIGFVGYGPARLAMGYAAEIFTLYVLDDHQGQGIGRALLHESFRALLRRGMDSAMLWVLAENPSRFFYEAMGAHRFAERDERLWGTVLHEAAYGWKDLRAVVKGAREKDRS